MSGGRLEALQRELAAILRAEGYEVITSAKGWPFHLAALGPAGLIGLQEIARRHGYARARATEGNRFDVYVKAGPKFDRKLSAVHLSDPWYRAIFVRCACTTSTLS